MGSVPFAFSVHHFINSVGADAGFAAIIGLAILVLLYFAQARETATLREQAEEAVQRVHHLEGRLAHLARAQPPAQGQQPGVVPAPPGVAGRPATPAAAAGRPVASAAPATAAASATSAQGAPVAPAGVGAPALTAATRLIPGAGGSAAPAEAAPAPAEPARASAAAAEQPPDATVITSPPPATAAGGANGGSAPAPVGAAAAARTGGDVRHPAQPAPRIQIRTGAAQDPKRRAAAALREPGPSEPPSRLRRVLPILIAVAALAAIVIVLVVLTSGGGKTSASSPTVQASNAPRPHHRPRPAGAAKPSSVTVAVLNGTATAGLAHRVAVKLAAAGYKQGTVATATDQTRTATVVAYLPGHRKDALGVASALKLGSGSVQAIDNATQAVACPPPAACAAGVVITVGSDLASTA